jgi:hypothetical protein
MELSELKGYIKDPLNEDDFEIIKNEVDVLLDKGEIVERMEFADYLAEILTQKGKQIEKANPSLYDQYQTAWLLLVFKSFVKLSREDQDNILQKRFLSVVQKGFDPEEIFTQLADFYYSDDFVGNLLRTYAKDLEENTENFGNVPLEVEGQKLFPQLKYWIQDYKSFPSQVAQRTSLERLNYVNRSINARQLTQTQRNTLLQILEFYDSCISTKIKLNELPDTAISEDLDNANLSTETQKVEQTDQKTNMEEKEEFYQPPVPPTYQPQQKKVTSATPKKQINIQQKLRDLKDRLNK